MKISTGAVLFYFHHLPYWIHNIFCLYESKTGDKDSQLLLIWARKNNLICSAGYRWFSEYWAWRKGVRSNTKNKNKILLYWQPTYNTMTTHSAGWYQWQFCSPDAVVRGWPNQPFPLWTQFKDYPVDAVRYSQVSWIDMQFLAISKNKQFEQKFLLLLVVLQDSSFPRQENFFNTFLCCSALLKANEAMHTALFLSLFLLCPAELCATFLHFTQIMGLLLVWSMQKQLLTIIRYLCM